MAKDSFRNEGGNIRLNDETVDTASIGLRDGKQVPKPSFALAAWEKLLVIAEVLCIFTIFALQTALVEVIMFFFSLRSMRTEQCRLILSEELNGMRIPQSVCHLFSASA